MMDDQQVAVFEAKLADLMDADVEHFKATRYRDEDGWVGYDGLGQWYSELADTLAMMAAAAWQAAKADSAQGAEPVAFGIFYKGVFQEHGWSFDAANAIAAEDYAGLEEITVEPVYTHPQPAVPEDVIRQCEDAIQYASEIKGGCISGVREAQKRVRAILDTPQPAAKVPECPYSCGWPVLQTIITENAAYFARATLDDEFDENIRQSGIASGRYALELCKFARQITTPQQSGEPAVCTWHGDDNGCWKGSCGIEWYFEDGGPDENGVNHCPRCGQLRVNEDKEDES